MAQQIKPVNALMTQKMWDELSVKAEQENRSRSSYIRVAIKEKLERDNK